MKCKNIVFFCLSLISIQHTDWQLAYGLPDWKEHDISTLKLINIVHRHGDRAPISFTPNDPYSNATLYWPEGVEQFSTRGKYRMYKLGEFIRKEYGKFLGDSYSPREVYARSSIEHRCIESVACVLAAAYPPNNAKWVWNKGPDGDVDIGSRWQPFPIETFMPKTNDTLLVPNKHCPNADKEFETILSGDAFKNFLANQSNFTALISEIVGEPIDTLHKAERLWDTIDIETDRGYVWSANWTLEQQNQVLAKLREFALLTFRYDWSTDLIKRVRVGLLIRTLTENMQSVIDNRNPSGIKLYIYSTHDTIVAPLLQALDAFNGLNPPFGAAVIFELHRNVTNDYFVRVYYFNETFHSMPYALKLESCALSCQFSQFRDLAKFWYYDEFDEICGTKKEDLLLSGLPYYAISLVIGALIGIAWYVSISAIVRSVRKKRFVLNHETS